MLYRIKIQMTVVAILIVLACFSGVVSSKIRKKQSGGEQDLVHHLLQRYNNLVRPAQKPTDVITVTFALTLIKILEVNEGEGTITTSVWQEMEWKDRNLRWDAEDYYNITALRIPIHRIWAPDIFQYNNDADSYYPSFSTNAIVRSTGSVTYVAPYIMATSCTYNPRERRQNCHFKYGSWTSNGREINLVLKREGSAETSRFTPNKNWELLGFHGNREEVTHDCCPEPYPSLKYTLSILRRSNSTRENEI